MIWTDGRVYLTLTRSQARTCAHPGPADADVAALRTNPLIRRQLDKLNPEIVRDSLREYGAWDAEELADHDQNLSRLLWIACGDIAEGNHA
jgi:hypothetical protein